MATRPTLLAVATPTLTVDKIYFVGAEKEVLGRSGSIDFFLAKVKGIFDQFCIVFS